MSRKINIKVNARHISQLGQELVTDYVTALSELVKNAYDADSEAVEVIFEHMQSGQGTILVADTGCGFTMEDIENKWAVIGTNNKVKNLYSPRYKRRCAGRKGIGRFSVERLAEHCTLYSFTEQQSVKYYMNWNKYEGIDYHVLKQRVDILKDHADEESAKYIKRLVEYLQLSSRVDRPSKALIKSCFLKDDKLDFRIFYEQDMLEQVEKYLYLICENHADLEEHVEEITNTVEELEGEEKQFYYQKLLDLYKKAGIHAGQKNCYTGTFLVLDCLRDHWTKTDIEKVMKDFRLLVPPFTEKGSFTIYVTAQEYELYEAELKNDILKQRYAYVEAVLEIQEKEDQKVPVFFAVYADRDGTKKEFSEILDRDYICGGLQVTLHFFLRDQSLMLDGLKAAETGEVLDTFCGVRIYRDGFRVRPYGEEGNDWLLLDSMKTKNPHRYHVSNNQIIGAVQISSKDNPMLIDASNREAIIENIAFAQLKQVVRKCIHIIEDYMYQEYLEQTKQSVFMQEAEKRMQEQSSLRENISQKKEELTVALQNGDMGKADKTLRMLLDLVTSDQQKEQKHYERIRQEYEKKLIYDRQELQLYKNLAALGIMAGSFVHETDGAIARILLNTAYARKQMLKLCQADKNVLEVFDALNRDIDRISCYSDLLAAFLKKKKRSEVKNLSFKNVIEGVVGYYSKLVQNHQITIDIQDLEIFECGFPMKQIDLESIIINLLTNAFEALKRTKAERKIKISASHSAQVYQIIVEDSGAGVAENLTEWIFLPLNTTKKEDGVGLGLAIVKDVVESYGGEIHVGRSEKLNGAKFKIEFFDNEV